MNNGNRSNIYAVVAYITWIGWIFALVARDPQDRFTAVHVNQALVLNIAAIIGGVIGVIPVIGGIAAFFIGIGAFALSILGIVRAAQWSDEPLPLIGDIHIIA